MARSPFSFADRTRVDLIRGRVRRLSDEVVVNALGAPVPPREQLKRDAEHLAYEDVAWLLGRIEENWE